MTVLELRLPVPRRRPHLRIGWFLLMPALLLAATGAVVWEIRTFRLQAWLLSTFARDLEASLGEGPAPLIRLERPGPYDERLGYAHLPEAIDRLREDGWQVAAQARLAPRHRRLVDRGMSPIYREKTQAGLEIFDPRGRRLYAVRYPQRVYSDFEAVPALVARTLLFIENRELLDPLHPFRNPAVEWDRFATAVFARGARLVSPGFKSHGGSTLATQLEKARHSPGGRTTSGAEKLRQMATASLRAYHEGPLTEAARRRTLVEYLNALPLAAVPGYGEVHGLGDGLWAWYGADFEDVNRCLLAAERAGEADPAAALAYRRVLALLLAQRRPAYYLVEDPTALDRLTDRYLEMLGAASLLPEGIASATPVPLRSAAPEQERSPLTTRKADLAVRTHIAGRLGVDRLYDLDRWDLTVSTTLDAEAQGAVTRALLRLAEPAGAREAGIAPLLGGGDPSGVLYSFTLYETSAGANAVRIQVDSHDQPLDLNDGAKLELGSTAKLRTLITYLELVAELYDRYAALPRAELVELSAEAPDRLTRFVLDFLAAPRRVHAPARSPATPSDATTPDGSPRARDAGLEALLEAAMLREYSASPWESFFTGGGLHHFRNFDAADNGRVVTVRQAFHRSVNLVFIRIMRDLVEHYRVRVPGSAASILDDAEHPLRRAYLERFADREGAEFLRRYYREYKGSGPDGALASVVADTRPIPKRLAAVHRSTRPAASFEEFEGFLRASAPHAVVDEHLARRLYDDLAPERLSLADRGYVARVHPLELWLVEYLARHSEASLADVLEASAGARQEVYGWLHRSGHRKAQDRRIRTLLEIEAFVEIHRAWRRLGYPFDSLVPSYATAIGSSADRPAALAELLGILVNDGVRRSTERFARLHFGAGTPFETLLERAPTEGERVLHREVATLVRHELLGVVRSGTATRARKVVELADGTRLDIGGKTGTGDNRLKRSEAGAAAARAGVMSRTASFVFVVGDRFYGTVVVYVPGQAAADYGFTSSAAVQVFNYLLPSIEPVLQRPVSREEWTLFGEPPMELPLRAPPRPIVASLPPAAPPATGALDVLAAVSIELERAAPRLTGASGRWARTRDLAWRRTCPACGDGKISPASVALLTGSTLRMLPGRRPPRGRGREPGLRARARREARRPTKRPVPAEARGPPPETAAHDRHSPLRTSNLLLLVARQPPPAAGAHSTPAAAAHEDQHTPVCRSPGSGDSAARAGVVPDRAAPGVARRDEEEDGDRGGDREPRRTGTAQERERRIGGHHRERDDEGEEQRQRAAEDRRRPSGGVEDRGHQVREVVDLDEQERHREHQHEQRVEDHDAAREEPGRGQRSAGGHRLAALDQRRRQQHEAGEEVRSAGEVEPAGGDEELRVGGLEQDEVERAEPDLLDGGHRRRLDHRRKDALHHEEEGRHQERLRPGPTRHPLAHREQDEERNERAHRPEDAEGERQKEVEPILQREQERRARLEREQSRIAGGARHHAHGYPPNAE